MLKQLIAWRTAIIRGITILLLLVSGLVVYWLFSPEILLFQFLHLQNINPLHADNNFLLILKSYYADAAWCIALVLAVKMLRNYQVHIFYWGPLLLLPFLSEWFQALNILTGTFDWFDVVLYLIIFNILFYKEVLTMHNTLKHIIAGLTVVIFAAAVIGSASPPPRKPIEYIDAVFTLPVKEDELFSKPSLSQVLKSSKNLSIVLRVPAPGRSITEEQKQKNSILYNTIEKEFAKAGFIVRDRLLFAKVLDKEIEDYSNIGLITETDLILELLNYDINQPYRIRQYLDEADGEVKQAPFDITFNSATVEFKLVSVKQNDLMGAYTFNYTPCSTGCKHRFTESRRAKSTRTFGNLIPTDFFVNAARKLIKEIEQRR